MVDKIRKIFPKCGVYINQPFQYDNSRIEYARIYDLKHPFEKQSRPITTTSCMMPLYDGFVLQRIFAEMVPDKESLSSNVHIVLTDLLTCTFSEDDWRYHGRAVICGTPSIISTTGIVEAPAKPKEFYLAQLGGMSDIARLKKELAGRFIDYGDPKMTDAAAVYALQALFFFVSEGKPFCDNKDCLLYNAHWQEELLHIIKNETLCVNHKKMANKFNKSIGAL
jgi:hypothetical protein